jgi:hypothetical protein
MAVMSFLTSGGKSSNGTNSGQARSYNGNHRRARRPGIAPLVFHGSRFRGLAAGRRRWS